jgi:hypothetical protein
MAGFDWEFRNLGIMEYIPPGSIIPIELKYDKVEREGSKKFAVSEILDSDESVMQDQGNNAQKIPVECYFVGDNYDLLADGFWYALSKRATQDSPGTLIHPRWGLIDVIPIKWKQSESFVSGIRRANFSVEFIRVDPPGGLFASIGLIAAQIISTVEFLEDLDLEGFITDVTAAVASIGDSLGSALDTVKGVADQLTNTSPGARSRANNIYLDALTLLDDPGANADLISKQIQLIARIPMTFEDDTLTKINLYRDIISKLITDTRNDGDVSEAVRRNKAIALERVAGHVVAVQNAGALSTNFKTRAEAVLAIDTLKSSYQEFVDALNAAKVEGALGFSFSGDHVFLDRLHEIHTRVVASILNDAFSLSSEASIVLSESSDPVSLCYSYYGSISKETIDFFVESNRIANSEFMELDAGREVKFYVS